MPGSVAVPAFPGATYTAERVLSVRVSMPVRARGRRRQ